MAEPDLTFYRGDNYDKNLLFKTPAGAAISIVGATIWFTMKENDDDTDASAVLQKKITTHTQATLGQSALNLSATLTGAIDPGDYAFDFQLKDGAGKVTTLAKGTVRVLQDVTTTDSVV